MYRNFSFSLTIDEYSQWQRLLEFIVMKMPHVQETPAWRMLQNLSCLENLADQPQHQTYAEIQKEFEASLKDLLADVEAKDADLANSIELLSSGGACEAEVQREVSGKFTEWKRAVRRLVTAFERECDRRK